MDCVLWLWLWLWLGQGQGGVVPVRTVDQSAVAVEVAKKLTGEEVLVKRGQDQFHRATILTSCRLGPSYKVQFPDGSIHWVQLDDIPFLINCNYYFIPPSLIGNTFQN